MTQLNKLKEAAREAAYDGKAFEFVLGIDFDSDEQWLPDELAMINQGITGAQKKREGTDKKIDKDNENSSLLLDSVSSGACTENRFGRG